MDEQTRLLMARAAKHGAPIPPPLSEAEEVRKWVTQQRRPATSTAVVSASGRPVPAPAPTVVIVGPKLTAEQAQPAAPFTCPRCGELVEGQAFYGPCGNCCQAVRDGSTVRAQVSPRPPQPPQPPAEAGPVLQRQQRRYRSRPTICRQVEASVAQLLQSLPAGVERVYLVGPRPGLTAKGDRAWFLGDLPEGWSHHEDGHYLNGASPVGKYLDPAGQRVELHRAATWFGEGDYSPLEAEAAVRELDGLLQGLGVAMLATPATTGRQLLLRMIPEREGGWPVLSKEHQALIRSTSGQGRIEVFPAPAGQLHEYDGRWFYGALCWGLGAGPAIHDDEPTWDAYARGRYRIRFTVPAGWTGPGCLMVPEGRDSWHWPTEGTWETWADGSELFVAAKAGWTFDVLERLLLTDSGANPLGAWADRLIAAAPEAPGLVRSAFRAMVIKTIGTLHGRPHATTKVVGLDQAQTIPAEAKARRMGQHIIWETAEAQAWPAMAHPEWSSAIWGRARARLMAGPGKTGALHLDGGHVVAMRTDAVYVTERQPSWEAADDGATGRLVYRGGRTTEAAQPTTGTDLLAARTWRA